MAIDELKSLNINKDSPIRLEDLIKIKSAVKNEVKRRVWRQNISSFAGTAYDYTNAELNSEKILASHLQKILRPMQAINPTKLGFNEYYVNDSVLELSSDDLVKNLQTLVNFLIECSKKPQGKSNQNISASDCLTQCSGLCVDGCGNSCTSCTSCSGGCLGCGSGCSNSCGGCDGGCSGCGDSCSTGCGGNCSGCSGNCQGCTNQCQGCRGRCQVGCGGCDGSCGTGCGSGCESCSSHCGGNCTSQCGGCGSACSSGCSNGCSGICGNTGTAI